ncbi:MAG: LemA family protein [Myxococcales bacterium]|nr:LemA family protein [Myxococcales bacterium]MDH5306602.1 LemA family protein [Myxococcales bacterium]MDH5567463.1 LemA family protein [Myxococcales bacterium]
MSGFLIVIGLVILLAIYFVALYNGLIRARNETRNGWSQIDVQLKRRHDLIPNLVETAKGYMKHEAGTFEKVVAARNQAIAARGPKQAGAAEGALTGALTGFFGLVEQYPDLKANQNFLALQEELSSTENRIGFARQAYNDAATRYNNKREVFPANLIAGGFEPAEFFEIADAGERAVPQVQF